MSSRSAAIGSLVLLSLLATAGCFFERRYVPPQKLTMQTGARHDPPAYDVWGRSISQAEADQLLQTDDGKAMLSPANGAVKIDDKTLKLGKTAFYEETFGN